MSKSVEMNKVDLAVRNAMTLYPTLYPTRASALRRMFLGTNYCWAKGDDGKAIIKPAYKDKKNFKGPTDTSDLDDSDARWNTDDEFAICIRLQNELERRNRLFRAEHIDLFAKMGSSNCFGYSDLDDWCIDSDYTVLATAPFGMIDDDWLRAIEEFLTAMMCAFNMVFSLHYDHDSSRQKPNPSMFLRMPEVFQRRYTILKGFEDKCEAQSGNKASIIAFLEAFNDDA